MARIAADFLTETLQQAGIKRVYGVVGDSLNGFTDSLRRHGTIEWVHMRHEEAAAFAAGAEAQLTGELAACCGSCGPGNLHLINGLYDCHRSRVPVLAIAAHLPSSELGIDYFQATHPEILFRECSHFVELVSNPNQLPQILERAMRVAVAKKGVAVVVLPGDIALMPLATPAPKWTSPKPPRCASQPVGYRKPGEAPQRLFENHAALRRWLRWRARRSYPTGRAPQSPDRARPARQGIH
ncbi:protein of unknown function [Hyphomicrobium sp. MC1]|nr:protein of unknown function [Hyphomicrobium sp. MC1]